jgi:hypothetical protein
MSLSASANYEPPVIAVRYIDVVLILAAAPIMLLIGVPAGGYLIGAGAWIALRLAGAGVQRYAASINDVRLELPLRLAYMISRLFLLALTVILVRDGGGRDAGLTALLVIVFAFTLSLGTSFADRPRKR